MILGVDTGLATFGWALLDERTMEPINLGVVVSEKAEGTKVHVDRARRITLQTDVFVEAVREATTVVVEQMSFGGGVNSMVPIALSYGAVLGVISALNPKPRLLTIEPQRWQREVVHTTRKKVDYEEVYDAGVKWIEAKSKKVWIALMSIPEKHRNHALDAMLLALVGAMKPDACVELVARDTIRGKRSKALRVVKDNGYPDYMLERQRRMALVMAEFPDWEPLSGVPATREQCKDGPRPCPYVRCRHHLWLLGAEDRAGNPARKAGTTFMPQSAASCALDLAEANDGEGMSTAEIGEQMGLDDTRIQGIVREALAKLKAAGVTPDDLQPTPG